ncbi:MAG: hypothetical protein LYZ70_02580 [Nitrososphaerales archaeon]|nr:hypothetical protein [Nitrososphaerales archaeon]
MRRTVVFLLLVIASLVAFLSVAVWYLSNYQTGNGSMVGIMGQMMGNQYVNGMASPMPPYVWTTVAAIFVLMAGGIGGLVYYLALPEIRMITTPSELPSKTGNNTDNTGNTGEDWAVMLRTSKPEEKKVLEVIASHDGRYLQKFVVKESGLSRLKTHRIISRFAERGIVMVAKKGNTNEVSLAPWLKKPAGDSKDSDT